MKTKPSKPKKKKTKPSKPKKKKARTQSAAQKKLAQARRAQKKQDAAVLEQQRERNASAKKLLSKLLRDAGESEECSLPGTDHNELLDFLTLRFLRHVVESDTFRMKVREALCQFDAQMTQGAMVSQQEEVPSVLWGAMPAEAAAPRQETELAEAPPATQETMSAEVLPAPFLGIVSAEQVPQEEAESAATPQHYEPRVTLTVDPAVPPEARAKIEELFERSFGELGKIGDDTAP